MEQKLLFALDIGTRSVVGLVGEQIAGGIDILAMERQEHNTRAMLDGQIHDVPEVAQVLASVKTRLESRVGPLRKVSVAAAGRALCTVKATAEIDCGARGALTDEDERALELAGIQTAQQQLATSKAVADPTGYYCVGYSVVRFSLDGTAFKSLIGQRGKSAGIELIATFLPRQVIDSLHSAIAAAGLEMATLTLEPIAAINVLIPPTMRHLNLALVDVGAGTSDVAITREGLVIGYGMVPLAGDEVTEAISQAYLLDFTVAEMLKRKLGGKTKNVCFTDVLGVAQKAPASEIVEKVSPVVGELAQAIAAQILALNATPPQAVLLVGGGSLTPRLPEAVAQALDIAPTRVAIRRPDSIGGIGKIPGELCAPDGVTPLGILKLANGNTLNFMQVALNNQPLRLFNLGKLTVADALLVAGIEIRSLGGRPGMGITVTVNGKKKSLPGSHGQPGSILVNSEAASFSHPLAEGDAIVVTKGTDGNSPCPAIADIAAIPPAITVLIGDELHTVEPVITVNGKSAAAAMKLSDRDEVICRPAATLQEVFALLGRPIEPAEYRYTINGAERSFSRWPKLTLNQAAAALSSAVRDNDIIGVDPGEPPTVAELLGFGEDTDAYCHLLFNGVKCPIPLRRQTVQIDGKAAELSQVVPPGALVDFTVYEVKPTVSDVLLAADFDPRTLPATGRIDVLVNGQLAEYTTSVKNGDNVDVVIR